MTTKPDEYDGYTDLVFTTKNNRTIVDKMYYEGQSRVSARMPLVNEDTLCYYLIAMGGGLTEGEKYMIKIKLDPNSRVILSTQAPTYIYKCDNNETTAQYTNIELGKNSVLEYIPDDIIPYRNAKYEQDNTVHMAKGSTLLYTDGVTAGWSPDSKLFQYTYVHMRSHIYYDDKLVYNDNLILDPNIYNLADLGLFESSENYTSLVAVDERIDEDFVHKVQQYMQDTLQMNMGVSKLEGPAMVMRVLGPDLNHNREAIMYCVNYLRKELLNSPKLELHKDASIYQHNYAI